MRKYLILFVITCFIACGKKEPQIPAEIIQPEPMTGILVDVYLAGGAFKIQQLKGDSLYQNAVDYYYAICEKHGVTFEQFRQSHKYYTQHPKLYEEVHVKVMEELSTLDAQHK